MKIKIIDLLNMISKGEEIPNKIKYEDTTFTLYINEENRHYYQDDECKYFLFKVSCLNDLNDEVEILEEKGIPEKINCWYNYNGTDDKELTKIMLDELKDKYNEIIDYLKSKG